MTTSVHNPRVRRRAPRTPIGSRGISVRGNHGIKVVRACLILRSAPELYAFCRNPENLPRILGHPVAIIPLDGVEPRWRVRVPVGDQHLEWDATLINDEPDRLLAWRSLEGAPVPNAGTVRFEPVKDGPGTTVTLQMEYDPPGGKLTAFFARLTGQDPQQQVAEALRRFKDLMESGENPPPESARPARQPL